MVLGVSFFYGVGVVGSKEQDTSSSSATDEEGRNVSQSTDIGSEEKGR